MIHTQPYLLPNVTRIMIFLLLNRQVFLIILLADFLDISRLVVSGSVALVVQSISRSVISHSVISLLVISRSVVSRSVVAPLIQVASRALLVLPQVKFDKKVGKHTFLKGHQTPNGHFNHYFFFSSALFQCLFQVFFMSIVSEIEK